MADIIEKQSRFLKLISGIETEAKKSEQAANTACDRVNIIRSTVVFMLTDSILDDVLLLSRISIYSLETQ